MHYRTPFLGLDFDPFTTDEAAAVMARRARTAGPFTYVATPNVDHVVRLDRNPALRPLYQAAWMNLCDSRILEVFAEASNIDLPAAPGSDVVGRLFERHVLTSQPVVIIGGTAVVAEKLRQRYGLRDLRWFDAPQGLRTDAAARAQCVKFIRDNPAPYVFIAVGSPQQEMIAYEAQASGDCSGLAICCGAALEFLAGEAMRAPEWMRSHRIEWLYRFNAEPERLARRYFVDGPRIFNIWCRWRNEPDLPTPANDPSAANDDMPVSRSEGARCQETGGFIFTGTRRSTGISVGGSNARLAD